MIEVLGHVAPVAHLLHISGTQAVRGALGVTQRESLNADESNIWRYVYALISCVGEFADCGALPTCVKMYTYMYIHCGPVNSCQLSM